MGKNTRSNLKIMSLQIQINDLKTELNEALESHDSELINKLEDRINNLHDLEQFHFENNTKPSWLSCGICYGKGELSEYEDTWMCPCCEGNGGGWV